MTTLSVSIMACDTVSTRIEHANALTNRNVKDVTLNTSVPIHYKSIRTANYTANKATIYIEGDGYAYISKSKPSSNPTPKTPVALMLSLTDKNSKAVYYVARPCQYIKDALFQERCSKKYWTTHRYSQEIMNSFHHTLNDIKSNTNIKYFDLIGFSGGGNIAGLLAASRDDIASIRTVAGNVDNDFFTKFHKVSPMPYSLNMADYAEQLSSIPQIHFIAEDDKFVPHDIYNNYQQQLPAQACVHHQIVKGTTHLDGWADRWPALLQLTPSCR